MVIVCGFLKVLLGALLIWIGAMQIVCAMLPEETAINVAKEHGAYIRKKLLKLPPVSEESQP